MKQQPIDQSILAPSITQTIKDAISRDAIVCLHKVWRGGGESHELIFDTLPAWLEYVETAKPGDLFYLWSIDQLRRENLLLMDSARSAKVSEDLREYLDKCKEVLVAGWGGAEAAPSAALVDKDSWTTGEEIQRRFEAQNWVVIAFEEASAPEHWLARGKVPDSNGEFPVGAY